VREARTYRARLCLLATATLHKLIANVRKHEI
jgi:hypothetical protein